MKYTNARCERVEKRPGKERRWRPMNDRPYPFNFPHSRWWPEGKRPKRDSMRQKCYNAEFAMRDQGFNGKQFKDIREIRYYVRNFMESDWFQRRFPDFVACEVEFAPELYRTARGGAIRSDRDFDRQLVTTVGFIRLASWATYESIVLHELAHAVCPRGEKHGRLWRRTFLEFVGKQIGREAEKALKAEFRKRNCKFNLYPEKPRRLKEAP